MWTTVLILATALNLEPNRLAFIALMLVRPRPIRQLAAFLAGSFATSAVAGLAILTALHRGGWVAANVNGAKAQIIIGGLALATALLLASNAIPGIFGIASDKSAGQTPGWAALLSNYMSRIVSGNSLWFSAAVGMGLAVPSVDYVALLVVIAASGLSLEGQAGALLAFLTIANAVLLIPITSYLVNPLRTTAVLERLRAWVLARRRRDYAMLLAIIGTVMIALGVRGL